MPSPVESAIRGVVTKGVVAIADFNRERKKSKGPNPFLEGLHTPVTEEVTDTALKVTGEIPAALNGLYVRNGPNPLAKVNAATHHWFIGDAMIHGIRLQDGKALWYRNRWVRSNAVSDALGEPRAPGPAPSAYGCRQHQHCRPCRQAVGDCRSRRVSGRDGG
jgi:carotenoid cleavage dioxygenase-like enzyme